jgi:hypothetical protein
METEGIQIDTQALMDASSILKVRVYSIQYTNKQTNKQDMPTTDLKKT